MAFLKSIIILIFCIGWVKAIQYDIDTEFDKVFQKIRNSFENAWKWIRTTANQNFVRMNQIFTSRQPVQQARHKYQDVAPVHEAGAKSDDTTIKSENTSLSLSSASPQTSQNTATASNPVTSGTESSTPQVDLDTTTNPAETPNSEKKDNETGSEITTTEEPQRKTEQSESDDTETPTTIETTTDHVQSEKQQLEKQTPIQVEQIVGKLSETQPKTEILLEGEHTVDKLESPSMQDVGVGDSPAVTENAPELDAKIQIIEPIVEKEKVSQIVMADDAREDIEFEKKRDLFISIYKEQNFLILLICFLSLVMCLNFFFVSRTSHSCPSIVIGDLGGNLKSATIHNIKK